LAAGGDQLLFAENLDQNRRFRCTSEGLGSLKVDWSSILQTQDVKRFKSSSRLRIDMSSKMPSAVKPKNCSFKSLAMIGSSSTIRRKRDIITPSKSPALHEPRRHIFCNKIG